MILFFLILFTPIAGQLLLSKKDIKAVIGREVYIEPTDLEFKYDAPSVICKVEVIDNEPMSQRVGLITPQVFDCHFASKTVKYVHHGSPLLWNDTVKLRAYKFLENDTIAEQFDLFFLIQNNSYEVVQPIRPLIVKEFFGLTDPIDDSILSFNFSRNEGALCKVKLSRHFSRRPSHGHVVLGEETRTIDGIRRRCDDFLQLGLRYEHLKPPSPNIDFIVIAVEVNDPYLNDGSLISEWYHIPVLIESGFPNLPPKASFSGMYLMDVDQFIITALTPTVLSATDSETPSNELIFNISKPLLPSHGSIVHLSDISRPLMSFKQSDLNNFDIAYKPPAKSFPERQMFEVGFVICDPDFALSELFTLHIAIRPAITSAPRVYMNVALVLLEGQSRPLRTSNLEIVHNDSLADITIFITGGLYHGRLEVMGKPAFFFTQSDIASESVVYHHDDSNSVRDNIHLRISDGVHSTNIKFPIVIVPKDDNHPSLVVNFALKVKEKNSVQMTPALLRGADHDTVDDHIKFVVTKPPSFGHIWKKLAWEKNGNAVLSFTQQDINKGLIYYFLQTTNVSTDFFEIVLQDENNPPNVSPPYNVSVQIIGGSKDPPKPDPASSFKMVVHENDVGFFNIDNLHYMDMNSLDEEILFSVTTPPRFIGSIAHEDPGKIVLFTGLASSQVSSFTQEQINHKKIAYVPPHKEIGPNPLFLQFIFSVMDKEGNGVTGQVFNITVLPVNNQAPQLHTSVLLVEEGSSTLLSTNEFSVYDPDTLSADLQISLFSVPLFGVLRRSNQLLRVGDLLSLDDILTLRMEYIHDGSENFKDQFKVGVNDGLHFVSGDVLISIDPVDDEKPVWLKDLLPRISVYEGSYVELTIQNLAATDIDTDDAALAFILTELPQFGNIVINENKVNHFSQRNIFRKEVLYVHNNQEIGPNPKEDSFTVIVTDKLFLDLGPHNSRKLFVTILPVNSQPPRLHFKRAILVEEGRRSVISEENLSATDVDTFPAELLFVVSKPPGYGCLENARPVAGYESSKTHKRVLAFPLQDLKNGFISFVQFNHSNIEPESDDFEVYVSDGTNNSTSILIYVSIILLNDEIPIFSIANLTVRENESLHLDNRTIVASDRDFPGDILVLTLQQRPKFGSLTYFLQAINNGPLLELPFKQLAFEKFEKIVYRHDGSENYTDSFTLSLEDGMHSVVRTSFITILPVNDEPPLLKTNLGAKNVEENFTFSSMVLWAEDLDSPSNAITFKITKPTVYGLLEKKSTNFEWEPLENLEFSQEDINLNLIRYRHVRLPAPLLEDGFTFFLFDGLHKSPPYSFFIQLVDRSAKSNLTLVSSGCRVERGKEVILNSSTLFASDGSSSLENIIFFIIKPPLYGKVNLLNDTSHLVKHFTASHVFHNQLSYKHDEMFESMSDELSLSVTNGLVTEHITLPILISSKSIPVLTVVLPLYLNDYNSSVITHDHLFSYDSSLLSTEVFYLVKESTKFGSLVLGGSEYNPENFTQNDVERGLVSYVTDFNGSTTDHFSFVVSNNKENGYVHDGEIVLKPTVFKIYVNIITEDVDVVVTTPHSLENVLNHQMGFALNSHNLKAAHPAVEPPYIHFNVVTYLNHGYLFNLKRAEFVKTFTQEEINEQVIVVILSDKAVFKDYFTFYVELDNKTITEEYRMDLQWPVVHFLHSEYSVCENAGAVNIVIKRFGYLNVSSYATLTVLEQTAKEGLDFVARKVDKIQFDPGVSETIWKLVILKDDLEEDPVEEMQLILTDPDNCIILNHNKLDMNIYDLNRGTCSLLPINKKQKYNSNPSSHSEECNQNTQNSLRFSQNSRTVYRCDGEKWHSWTPENNALSYSEENVVTTTEITLSMIDLETCQKGWQKYGTKCHKWFRTSSTWKAAEITCKTYALGRLVGVDTLEYNNWLLQLARNRPFWIGFPSEDKGFTNWKKGFSPASGKNRCILVRGTGFWITKNCETQQHSFICAIPL